MRIIVHQHAVIPVIVKGAVLRGLLIEKRMMDRTGAAVCDKLAWVSPRQCYR